MICHETYKNSEGKWLSPDDIVKNADGIFQEIATGKPVNVGRIEKMSHTTTTTHDTVPMIDSCGVDAERLFMLSDSPPERDLEWTDAGIEGAWRYIGRLWRLVKLSATSDQRPKEGNTDRRPITADNLQKATHKTIAAVTDDLEKFHFNKAIARIRELTNLIEATTGNFPVKNEAIITAIHLINPFMPHLAEELWQQLGNKDELATRPFPIADAAFLIDDSVTIAVQVNGKMRGTFEATKDADKSVLETQAMALPNVAEFLQDKKITKIIVVPNRIVNVVVS
jgi:leucyl-tRNA synthetase